MARILVLAIMFGSAILDLRKMKQYENRQVQNHKIG